MTRPQRKRCPPAPAMEGTTGFHAEALVSGEGPGYRGRSVVVRPSALLLCLAAACSRPAPAGRAAATPGPPSAIASVSLPSTPPPAPANVPLATPPEDFGVPRLPPAPIVVTGYPHNVKNGMNDPA